jgi:hypothetical protein
MDEQPTRPAGRVLAADTGTGGGMTSIDTDVDAIAQAKAISDRTDQVDVDTGRGLDGEVPDSVPIDRQGTSPRADSAARSAGSRG